jgi:glycosyltransferase involved in cell wall biosynthesis
LAGATGDADYAARIHKRLQEIVQNNPYCRVIVLDSFLSPPSLAAVFMRTALNFHPCSYDAYGMTVIEAAAFGVPSVIASGTKVGASAILGGGGGDGGGNDGRRCGGTGASWANAAASIPVNFSSNTWHNTVRDALSRPQQLQEIGAAARHHAFSWDETAYGAKLLEYMMQSVMEKTTTWSSISRRQGFDHTFLCLVRVR